ncbi:hypothetical protein [Marinobacter subterrani]|uniref:hypothetical protein n=1 Tax=Marinobacter subterrani TaxID=1658765 RepID=UPI002352F937|nr:hypothetical protein [Marinobacter subterrani]
MQESISGRSQFGSRELDSQFLAEAISLAYGKTASFINDVFSNGLTHGAMRTGLEGAAKAFEDLQSQTDKSDRFLLLSNWIRGITEETLTTAKDHVAFARNWMNEAEQTRRVWDYYRNGMSEPELLMVEPTASIMSGLTGRDRDRHDFSGDFRTVAHRYSDESTCQEIYHGPKAAAKEGFIIGPAAYRQYAAILEHMSHHQRNELPWDTKNKTRAFMGGTPFDLPARVAQQRLGLIDKLGVKDRYPESARELSEIVNAHQMGRSPDIRMFQAASLQLRPRDHLMQVTEHERLEKLADSKGRTLEKLRNSGNCHPNKIALLEQRHREWSYYRDHHKLAPQVGQDLDSEPTQKTPTWAQGENLSRAIEAVENEINKDAPMTTNNSALNTRLELGYRTESDKAYQTVILPGAITQEQVNRLSDGLFDGFQIIAHQVDLPTPSEQLSKERTFPEPDDHVLTTLEDWLEETPEAETLHTTEPPTESMTVEELTTKITEIGPDGWDFLAEEERLDIPLEDDYADTLSM